VDKTIEQPLFDPTVYCVAQLRSRNLAANSIRNRSYSILALLLASNAAGIKLMDRVSEARPLTLPEFQLISRYCRFSVDDLRLLASTEYAVSSPTTKMAYITGLKPMAPATFRIRLDDVWETANCRLCLGFSSSGTNSRYVALRKTHTDCFKSFA
jgi:hypothetical protein